jgi:hypothetical protein
MAGAEAGRNHRRRRLVKRLAALLLALLGCYAPSLKDGQFTCEKSSACPNGFQCVCGVCRKDGTSGGACQDMAVSSDMKMSTSSDLSTMMTQDLATPPDLRPATGGCSTGTRSTLDPGHANVAFCPAAWAVAGLNTTTPCNRVVGTNGKSGGTNCTSEDNCAAGWHVCTDETEAGTKGLTKTDCMNAGAGVFFVTRQDGMPPSGASPGPPQCLGSMVGPVFGCGNWGSPADANTCTLLQTVLINGMGGSDMCSSKTGGVFSCGTVSGPEYNDVVKTTRDTGGGVICCTN